jgi:hypothetical protein
MAIEIIKKHLILALEILDFTFWLYVARKKRWIG